jgi:hypothetical protein
VYKRRKPIHIKHDYLTVCDLHHTKIFLKSAINQSKSFSERGQYKISSNLIFFSGGG